MVEGVGGAGILRGGAGVTAWMGVLDSPGHLYKTAVQNDSLGRQQGLESFSTVSLLVK